MAAVLPTHSSLSSPPDSPLNALLYSYCTVHGLESETGRLMNGQEVYVAKIDPDDANRVGVIFVYTLATPSICRYVSLRPENLTPKYGVAVKPSSICNSPVGSGGGLGVFATKAFAKGEVIMQELPFATVPPAEDSDRTAALIANYHKKLSAPQRDVLAQLTLGNVEAEKGGAGPKKEESRSIPNKVRALGEWAIRLHTNCICTDDGAMHLYPVLCRINHRCMGERGHNVWWRQECGGDGASASQPRYLTASRPIAAGEEILVDYIDSVLLDPVDRHEALARYGIPPCPAGTCVSCNPPYCGGGGGADENSVAPKSEVEKEQGAAAKKAPLPFKTREEGLTLIKRYHDGIGALGAAMAHVIDAPLGSMLTTKEWVQWYEATSVKLMGLTAVFGLNESRAFDLMIGVLYPQGDALYTLIKHGLQQYDASSSSSSSSPSSKEADDAANKKQAAEDAAALGVTDKAKKQKKAVEVNVVDLLKMFSLFKKNIMQRQQLMLEFYGGNAEHPLYVLNKRSSDADLKGAVAEFMRRGIRL